MYLLDYELNTFFQHTYVLSCTYYMYCENLKRANVCLSSCNNKRKSDSELFFGEQLRNLAPHKSTLHTGVLIGKHGDTEHSLPHLPILVLYKQDLFSRES